MLLIVSLPLLSVLGSLTELALGLADDADWLAVVFRRLALGLLLTVWVGIVLAELGLFEAIRVAGMLLLATIALVAYVHYRRPQAANWRAIWRPGRPTGRRETVAVLALLGAAAWLFGQPGEDVLGARDPGIYYATGVAIARDGGILQHDWALQALGSDLGDGSINYWLFQSVHGWPLRFPGQLFVRDLSAGIVEPGFLPWYPTAVALAVDAAGLGAGVWVNPALSMLALLAVYLTGRVLFGPLVAWLGAALLAVNLAEVWFARYTLAEPVTQLLVWTGLYALVTAARRPTVGLGVLAGAAWAGTLLARVDAVLLVPVVVAYLAWWARRPGARPCALTALALIGLGACHLGLHAWRFAPGYVSMVFSPMTLAVAAGGVAATLVVAAAAWLLVPAAGRVADGANRRRVAVLVGLIALLALFAYAVRPALPLSPLGEEEAAALDTAARESLVRLGWYVTPLGLALALAGAARLLWTGAWRAAALPLALLGLSLAFYLPNPLVSSDQPWAARRYLPVVLPGLLLLAAHGAVSLGAWVGRASHRRLLGGAAGAALWLAVALGEARALAPIVAYREHAGALDQTEALAALFPPGAVVLFPRSPAGVRLSLPLHYLGARASFVLPAAEPVDGVLDVVRRWSARGHPVYWVVPVGTRFPTPPGVRFRLAGQFTFEVPQLERPLDRLPTRVEPLRYELQLYRVELATEAPVGGEGR